MNIFFNTSTKKGSVRNVFLIIIAILLVGGAFAFAEYRNNKLDNIYKAPQVTVSNTMESAEIDTDNDGMKDWEEILVGSDPKDPKSKVALSSNAPVSEDITKKALPLSQTDLISRDFFARYMELRQLGAAGDAISQNDAVMKTIGNISLPTPKSYKLEEITTKNDNSPQAIKQYGNEIGGIFIRFAIQSRNEAVIAKEALEAEDPELLAEIDPIVNSYKNILNALLKTEAPKAVEILHLDLVNSINGALFVAQSLRKADSDPIAGAQAVNMYLIVEKQLLSSTKAIKSYFSYLGVTYGETEPGYLFTKQ